MLSAVILIDLARGSARQVGQSLANIKGVKTVLSVAGRFDIVVIADVGNMEELSVLVNVELDKIPEITSVETMVSMQVFSQGDLEHMFSIGFEDHS